ncbi:MAG: iron uptake porin [Candidatus Nanopelagicaceae bacterium]
MFKSAFAATLAATPLVAGAAFAEPFGQYGPYVESQVTSITQFSDVRPTDWAYQALTNLIERYGCVAGYPNGTYGGGKAMTRYEAAALLNACLDRVTEVTDELRKLQAEFKEELIVLRGRVDGLEAKVGVLEATQFSTTTKLKGEATFVLGGVPGLETNAGGNVGNTAFNYDVRLNFDTSFTGRDLLRTRLRSANFSSDPFGSSSSLFKLDKADNTTALTGDNVVLDRLYYQFPVGDSVTITAGPKVRNTEMAWVPSAYKSEILDFFQVAGAPGVYNKATGAGVGAQYVGKGGFVAGLNYVAQEGDDSSTGVFDEDGALNFIAQLGYKGSNWGIGAGYRYGSEGTRPRSYNGLLGASGALVDGQESNAVAINAYWQPSESGWVPSISAGYGYNFVNGATGVTDATDSDSWFVGLQWTDAFIAGNTAGVAVGQAPSAETDGVDDATMLEFFYKFQVTDNISITPALFYVDNNQRYQDSSKWGGVIQTKFTF